MKLTPKQLRQWLDRARVSQRKLAEAFGQSEDAISHMLAGRRKLTEFRAHAYTCYLTLIEVSEQQLDALCTKIARHTNTVLQKRLQYVVVGFDDRTGIRVNFNLVKWFDDEGDAIEYIQDKNSVMILRYEDHRMYDNLTGEEIEKL